MYFRRNTFTGQDSLSFTHQKSSLKILGTTGVRGLSRRFQAFSALRYQFFYRAILRTRELGFERPSRSSSVTHRSIFFPRDTGYVLAMSVLPVVPWLMVWATNFRTYPVGTMYGGKLYTEGLWGVNSNHAPLCAMPFACRMQPMGLYGPLFQHWLVSDTLIHLVPYRVLYGSWQPTRLSGWYWVEGPDRMAPHGPCTAPPSPSPRGSRGYPWRVATDSVASHTGDTDVLWLPV